MEAPTAEEIATLGLTQDEVAAMSKDTGYSQAFIEAMHAPMDDVPELTEEELEELRRKIIGNSVAAKLKDEHKAHVKGLAANQLLDFEDMLADQDATLLQWPYRALRESLGPLLPGTLTVVGARPGCGKTTLLLNCLKSWVRDNKRVLYLGMETSPQRLRLEWAALDCGFEKKLVLRKRWDLLPPWAKEKLREHRAWQESIGDLAIFADNQQVSVDDLEKWVQMAHRLGVSAVVIDHLHRMTYGQGSNPTEEMSRGIIGIKRLAVKYGVPIIAAAQLSRGERDLLANFEPPPLEALKQTGTTEAEADDVLMLHRRIRDDATKGDKALVRMGSMKLSDVIERGAMGIHLAKCRIDGDSVGEQMKLYVHGGAMYETEGDYQDALFGKGGSF